MARRRRTRNAAVGKDRSADDDRRLAGDAVEQVDDVLVDHAHAARRHRLADGPPFRRAMHAVAGVLAVLDRCRARARRAGCRGRPAGRRAISPARACGRSSRPAASRSAISCRTGCWRGPTSGSRRGRCRRRSGARRRPAARSRGSARCSLTTMVPGCSPVGSTTIWRRNSVLHLLVGDRRQHEAFVGERGIHHVGAGDALVDADLRAHRDRAGREIVELERRHLQRRRACRQRRGADAGEQQPASRWRNWRHDQRASGGRWGTRTPDKSGDLRSIFCRTWLKKAECPV